MTTPRDVVLVTIDSLRADRCGFLGSTAGLTPTMDRLAGDGLLFENAISPAGSTRGSSTSFLTGQYPIDRPTATTRTDTIRQHVRTRETLAERFSRMGYQTAAFTANPWTSRFFDFDAGFDHFQDFIDDELAEEAVETGARAGGMSELVSQLRNWWEGQDMFLTWESFYDEIRSWLGTVERPYFLWIFLVDVHMPYLPPRAYQSQSTLAAYAANTWLFADQPSLPVADSWLHDRLVTAYDDTVRYTDAFVEQLLTDLGDDPLVCVHADHGELLGEGGAYGHGDLHEHVVHVPLFVANHPPRRISRPFSLRGLPDLLTDLATGRPVAVDDPVVTARNNGGMRIVRGESWRYVKTSAGDELQSVADQRPIRDDELLELGRLVTDYVVEAEQEKRRLTQAAVAVAATGRF
jgi:arylsulfatase A-like enzyme